MPRPCCNQFHRCSVGGRRSSAAPGPAARADHPWGRPPVGDTGAYSRAALVGAPHEHQRQPWHASPAQPCRFRRNRQPKKVHTGFVRAAASFRSPSSGGNRRDVIHIEDDAMATIATLDVWGTQACRATSTVPLNHAPERTASNRRARSLRVDKLGGTGSSPTSKRTGLRTQSLVLPVCVILA
jgi:hypothetical protein